MSSDPAETVDLSQTTVGLIHAAAASRDAARAAKKQAASSHAMTLAAQQQENADLQASADAAHQWADDAQKALDAVTADLGIDMPEPPPTPDNGGGDQPTPGMAAGAGR
jgi:hypothetical protein